MNNIHIIQNSQKQIERIAAQRELYSTAKRFYGFQLFGNVLLPIVFSMISIFKSDFSVCFGLYGICFYVIDILIIEQHIEERRTKAAKIQELFDCDVLLIKKSPLKIANDIAVEEVLTYYNAYSKMTTNIEKLKDWYPQDTKEISIHYARLICQRTNCWWDSKLRFSYITKLKYICILSGLAIIVFGIMGKLQFEQVVLITSGLIPFFQFSSKQYYDNISANDRLQKVADYINDIWENIITKTIDINSLEEVSRRIQDEFYENRIKSPLILDSFYGLFRKKTKT
jgi:hypothetical protein